MRTARCTNMCKVLVILCYFRFMFLIRPRVALAGRRQTTWLHDDTYLFGGDVYLFVGQGFTGTCVWWMIVHDMHAYSRMYVPVQHHAMLYAQQRWRDGFIIIVFAIRQCATRASTLITHKHSQRGNNAKNKRNERMPAYEDWIPSVPTSSLSSISDEEMSVLSLPSDICSMNFNVDHPWAFPERKHCKE